MSEMGVRKLGRRELEKTLQCIDSGRVDSDEAIAGWGGPGKSGRERATGFVIGFLRLKAVDREFGAGVVDLRLLWIVCAQRGK